MTLSSPLLLVAGLLVVAGLVVCVVLFGRRRAAAPTAAGISIPSRRGRQLGAGLTLAGVFVLAVAVSGPAASLPVGRQAGTVILAMDVSNSMSATDVAPTRLAAAQEAAIAFVNAQPGNVDIGVVGFDQGAITTSRATDDRAATVAAIKALKVSGGTSIGSAVLASLTAITGKTVTIGKDGTVPNLGYWGSATIVLLSDGEDRAQPDAATAAATAAQSAGVHIDTVGIGTAAGANVTVDGYSLHTALDADNLTTIAQTTGGTYHPASDAQELNGVASSIDLRLTVANEDVPLAGAFIAFALVLLGAGAVITVVRTGKVGLMTFDWPWALLALLLVPVVLGISWWMRRRRRKAAVRVTSIALVRMALPGRTRWQRKIPAALLVLGLLTLSVGAARPQANVAVPTNSTTIMLALDTSRSMCSTDVTPNRITVAEEAAISFIKARGGGVKIGLVTFAGVAGLLVPPTTDTSSLITAIQNLSTSRGTAIGSALLASIDGIAAIDPAVAPTGADLGTAAAPAYAADVIVLLTDGANTQGVTPAQAATVAAARGVRVFTIGFGTTTPTRMACTGTQVEGSYDGGRNRGGGGGGGGVNPLIIDEAALQNVAKATGGQYYRAQNADQLQSALGDLPSHVTVVHRKADLAAWFAGGGGLLVVLAVALSLWWNRVRLPPVVHRGVQR